MQQTANRKNICIIYATREGQTEKVAIQIAIHLRNAAASVQLSNAIAISLADIDLAGFDLLVFGGSMHAGGLEKELVNFINCHQHAIEPKVRSFFLVLLSAATKDASLRATWLEDARTKMAQQLQVHFPEVEMIAGALKYSRYSLPLQWMMQRIAKQAGEGTDTSRDYEYTDWQQVKQYSVKLLEM